MGNISWKFMQSYVGLVGSPINLPSYGSTKKIVFLLFEVYLNLQIFGWILSSDLGGYWSGYWLTFQDSKKIGRGTSIMSQFLDFLDKYLNHILQIQQLNLKETKLRVYLENFNQRYLPIKSYKQKYTPNPIFQFWICIL